MILTPVQALIYFKVNLLALLVMATLLALTSLTRTIRLSGFSVSDEDGAPFIGLLDVIEKILQGGAIFSEIGGLDDLHQVSSGFRQ
jgi:hypothetical protein